jgi:acyl-CoA reductase-like NAD-dependent aldehyde dehydrogenase
MKEFKLLINGKLVSGAARLDVINPATEEVLASAPRADRAQLEEALAAAKARFPTGRRNRFVNEVRCCPNWPMHWKSDKTSSRDC